MQDSDEDSEESGGGGDAGEGSAITLVPEWARFSAGLLYCVRKRGSAAFFGTVEAAREFQAKAPGHPDWVALAKSLDGVALVFVRRLEGGFEIWRRHDGKFLVYRNGVFKRPPHDVLSDAEDAVVEMLAAEVGAASKPPG